MYPYVQRPPLYLCAEPRLGRYRIYIHLFRAQPIRTIHILLADRLCMGCYAGITFHHSHQCLVRRAHGNLSGTVQRNNLHTANRSRSVGRKYFGIVHAERDASTRNKHAGNGGRDAHNRSRLRISDKRNQRRKAVKSLYSSSPTTPHSSPMNSSFLTDERGVSFSVSCLFILLFVYLYTDNTKEYCHEEIP